jgi:hypothetical protein
LIAYGADPDPKNDPIHQPLKMSECNGTLIHGIIESPSRTVFDASAMIALYCKAGVNPQDLNGYRVSPLTFLIQRINSYPIEAAVEMAQTLIHVGAVTDEQFEQECLRPELLKLGEVPKKIAAVKQTAQKAKSEVNPSIAKQQKYHEDIIALLENRNLSRSLGAIVIAYAHESPHSHFINKILTDADATLQKKRKDRENAGEKSCCIIQ